MARTQKKKQGWGSASFPLLFRYLMPGRSTQMHQFAVFDPLSVLADLIEEEAVLLASDLKLFFPFIPSQI